MTALNPWKIKEAARVLQRGGIVAYPTEAVYGLGCDPLDGPAVLRLLELKQRDLDKGLILIAAAWEQLRPYLGAIDARTLARVRRSWPGPVTWLLPARAEVPIWLRGRHASLAVRVTAHPVAAALCRATGSALVSTSANISGHPAARTALAVRRAFGDRVDYVVHGGLGTAHRPTEIRDARSGRIVRAA